jgi:diguanylate cyclase
MSDKPKNKVLKNPTDIARETFRRLAVERIAPTPDAYQKLYFEISGISDAAVAKLEIPQPKSIDDILPSEAEMILSNFAKSLQKSSGDLVSFGHRFQKAMKSKNWADYTAGLNELASKVTTKQVTKGISLVDPIEPLESQSSAITKNNISLVDDDSRENSPEHILKDMLFRVLSMALTSLLKASPELSQESESIGITIKAAANLSAFNSVSSRLKQLCFQIELKSGDTAEQQELLLRLFALLLENVKELLDDDSWIRGQIDVVHNLISGPIDHRSLQDATRGLKDVIYKQGVLKHSIAESKTSVKNMMAAFIERLTVMTESTTIYQGKMDLHSQEMLVTKNTTELNLIINNIINDTKTVQAETDRSYQVMISAQKEVKEAEIRIKELEDKLAQMSELIREDQLTGSLNRRGLDDVFERESDRADRRGTPLCAAMLDLDNFKKLNDTHGHSAGDEALIHVVRIVKQTLRSIDVIARYGGEEFLIVMPETTLDEAARAMVRVQRELTTHFFMANEQRLFITFSAGVALRALHESQDSVIKRADKAMYEAKKSGKNRVVIAE